MRHERSMMTPVAAVAKFIIQESDRVSNLKLQKLLYYVQGWHLGLKGTPVFGEELEAWVHGPVVPSTFQIYRVFGWRDIEKEKEAVLAPLLPDHASHIREVLRAYGKFSGDQLERLSHTEDPWMTARKELPSDARSNYLISKSSMREYFAGKARAQA